MTNATFQSRKHVSKLTYLGENFRRAARAGLAAVLIVTLLGSTSLAQDEVQVTIVPKTRTIAQAGETQQPQTAPDSQTQQSDTPLVLPPGTILPLGLTRPLSLRSSRARGAGVYLQVTFPVTVGTQMVIPPGAYIQGFIEKVTKDSNGNPDLQIEISSASLIFSTGYTVPITGTVSLLHKNTRLEFVPSPDRQAMRDALLPNAGNRQVPAMGAVGQAPGLPPLPPLPDPSHGFRTAFIAIGAIIGVATVALIVVGVRHRNDIYLETGTPLEIVLSSPLLLDARQVNAAVQQYASRAANAPPQIVQPPKRPEWCYDSGSAGTPDTVIPGIPATPDRVIPGMNGAPDTVIPGSMGTPDTVIPGFPATPPSWHRCP